MTIALAPVDGVTITTLVDNSIDAFMPDQGPAHRPLLGSGPSLDLATLVGPAPESLVAEHGFSALVSVHKNGTDHHLLYDAGVSPDGLVENMRRLEVDPTEIQDRLYAVIGGFHLNGPFERLIPQVCADLGALHPSVLVPAHCTGWRASHALARAFGEAYVPNSVGTRFVL